MQALRFLFSPAGRLSPRPFIYGAVAVYGAGAASHWLTAPDILSRAGFWPFAAVQVLLVWSWFDLHAKRLRDGGLNPGLAVGVGALYVLSVALLLIVAANFFSTSGLMGNANATSALGLVLILTIVATLAGTTQYDLGWAVVAILMVLACLPIVVALGFTAWTATRPSVGPAGAAPAA